MPVPCRAGVELVDARSGVRHRVSPEELLAGQALGNYVALCGARLRAASLTDPGRRDCRECLPERLLCVTCMWFYLVPVSVFPRQIPAGRRSSPISPASALRALGGRPVPDVALLDHGQHVEGMEAGG